MPRSLRALILLAVIVWQSAAMFGSVAVEKRAGDLAHWVVHAELANHHHHPDSADLSDGALHMGDDEGPLQHVHADTGAYAAGLLISTPPQLAQVRSQSPPEANHCLWLSPVLAGPLRPPRQNA